MGSGLVGPDCHSYLGSEPVAADARGTIQIVCALAAKGPAAAVGERTWLNSGFPRYPGRSGISREIGTVFRQILGCGDKELGAPPKCALRVRYNSREAARAIKEF